MGRCAPRRLEFFLDQTLILPAGLTVATVWVNWLPGRSDVGGPGR
jgi:hypothetical protein